MSSQEFWEEMLVKFLPSISFAIKQQECKCLLCRFLRKKGMNITYFTKEQNQIEKWITDMGFKVKSEVDIENYTADLVINELGMIVEVDGPSHRKIKGGGRLINNEKDPKASKRDKKLLSYYPNGIFHVSVDIDEETFKKEFERMLNS